MRTVRRAKVHTDMTKLIFAFRNFAKALKNMQIVIYAHIVSFFVFLQFCGLTFMIITLTVSQEMGNIKSPVFSERNCQK
jgi:hypothetical protein